ncbi:MAG: mechanosensitive ion channel domain-containing protein, partial [Lactobacillus crispatus]
MDAKEIYTEWQKATNLPDYLKDQLNTLGKDEKWIEDAFGQDINFGTAGMRGRLEPGTNRINLFTVGRVTEGLARLIEENGADAKKRGVAISFDSRYHSREFAEHAARVLGAHGIHVYLFDDLRPTPELSYAVRHLHTFAGINITASHNAKQYNGYKVYGEDGAQMAPDNADRLFAYAQKVTDIFAVKAAPVKELRANGTLQLIGEDVDEDYLNELKQVTVDPEMVKANADKLKIIYTPLHGTGKMLYDRAFRQGGFDNVIPVPSQSIIDPEFPTTIKPNPEYRDVFEPGFKLANKVNANVIIATDPDADRMGAAVRKTDGDFQVLTGNQIATLMAYYLLAHMKENGQLTPDYEIVTSVVSSALPFKIAEDFGIKTKHVLTGFKYIGEEVDRMNKAGDAKFLMGFEESYGYLFKPFARDKDAMQGALMFAEVASYYASRGMTVFDGLQDTVSNLIGGLGLMLAGVIKPGDHVTIGDISGEVTDINWRSTIVRERTGRVQIIPNSVLNKTAFTHRTRWAITDVAVPVLVKPSADLDVVTKEIIEVAQELLTESLDLTFPIEVRFESITNVGVQALVHLHIRDSVQAEPVADKL